jgi:tetratricopeptide (TPR) repeat protein
MFSRRGRRRALSGAAALFLISLAGSAIADSEGYVSTAQAELTNVDREAGSVQDAVARAKAQKMTPEQRLANAELLYRSKDYARASVIFSEIMEEYPNTPSYTDALWLLGETYYASKEYLSARREYREIVQHGTEPRYSPYFGRALARLVDVCLRVNDIKGLDDVFSALNSVPPAQVDAALLYAKGKAYYAKKDYSSAQGAFQSVPAGAQYTHQARYFLGLVAIKTTPPGQPASPDGSKRAVPANYKNAIDVFKQATDLPPDSDEHKEVIDLSWMAIGRLYYEMEQYTSAAEAYQKVGRDSKQFSTMLYELAWDYVRLGDVQRAERALEVLSVVDPGGPLIGDGSLLRADLLLRAGAFDKSLQLYESVKKTYDPMRAQVETFLDSTSDVKVYYDRLSHQQMDELEQKDQLPPIAVRWAREAEDGPMAFAVIEDINQCKTLIKQSYKLIDKLSTIIGAANRVRAFPELLAGQESALALLNRISRARLELAKGLDSEEPGTLSGEIADVRKQRRDLMGQIETLPTNSAEFASFDYAGMREWNSVSQDLSRQTLEVDHLQAVVNGLRRMLKEDGQRGVARDADTTKRFQDELEANERDLKLYQNQMVELKRQIEIGRAQIGLGDSRYQAQALARLQFRDALDREVQLASQGQAGAGAQKYASRIQPLLTQARTEEDRLILAFNQIQSEVESRIGDIRNKIEAERVKIDGYNGTLFTYDTEAKQLVGEVAKRNFEIVREKLRSIVLRADVGITEQAWEVREEELDRVHNLQTERAREEQLLDEELREVLDDSGETNTPSSSTPKK